METLKDTVMNQAESDPFSINAKSSVKIVKNTKGVNHEIKIVTGEEDLIDSLIMEAIKSHKKLELELNDDGGK